MTHPLLEALNSPLPLHLLAALEPHGRGQESLCKMSQGIFLDPPYYPWHTNQGARWIHGRFDPLCMEKLHLQEGIFNNF